MVVPRIYGMGVTYKIDDTNKILRTLSEESLPERDRDYYREY